MADLNFKYVDVPNQQERTPEGEMSEAAATRSRLFGADLVPENPNKHLHSTLHERFRAWDTRQIRWQQFIFEVEQLIEKPVEPELETYVRNVDEGRLPSSFRDFLSKLLQGKNSLAGLKMPRVRFQWTSIILIFETQLYFFLIPIGQAFLILNWHDN